MEIVAIVNPASGVRRARREWPALLKAQEAREAQETGEAPDVQSDEVTTWWTEGPGHAAELAARARRAGFGRVVAVGGDGTLSEVVNGLWWEPEGRLPGVGFVPLGTGCDYPRSFAAPGGAGPWLEAALGAATTPVDVGVCRLEDARGAPVARAFINVLGVGWDARVIERLRGGRPGWPPRVAYALAALPELVRNKAYSMRAELEGESLETESFLWAVGLGRYFGAGMQIAPGASPRAGRFQVVWGEPMGRVAVLGLLRRIYGGGHLEHPLVHARLARRLSLRAAPRAPVEADGEFIGRTPVEVRLHPGALDLAAAGPAVGCPDKSDKTKENE